MKWLTDLLKKLFSNWWQKKKPDVIPTPEPDKPASDEWNDMTIHVSPEEVRGWQKVCDITVTQAGGDYIIDTDKRDLWPDIGDRIVGNVWCFLFRNGKWHAGPFDGLRPFPCKRDAAAFCVPLNTSARFATPERGEKVGVATSGVCRSGEEMRPKQRSGITWIVWP